MDRLADLALVAVGRRGVDVPIPGAECAADGVPGLVGGRLEDPQTEGGHLEAVIEGDGLHLLSRPWGPVLLIGYVLAPANRAA